MKKLPYLTVAVAGASALLIALSAYNPLTFKELKSNYEKCIVQQMDYEEMLRANDKKIKEKEQEKRNKERKEKVILKLNRFNVKMEKISSGLREKSRKLEEKSAELTIKNYISSIESA